MWIRITTSLTEKMLKTNIKINKWCVNWKFSSSHCFDFLSKIRYVETWGGSEVWIVQRADRENLNIQWSNKI